MGIKTDIALYTEGTPNGLKISIVLEELGLDYKVLFLALYVMSYCTANTREGRDPRLQQTRAERTLVPRNQP